MAGRRRWVRTTVAAGAVLAATGAINPFASGASAGAAPRQDAGGDLEVTPGSGHPGEPLTISGTGCAGGLATVRIDGQAQFPYPAGSAEGDWTMSLTFPAEVGPHDIDADCSDFTTAGAPTTFYGPGDLRFTYTAVQVVTEAPQLVDPTVTAPPTAPPAAPPAPAPARPTEATATYTG